MQPTDQYILSLFQTKQYKKVIELFENGILDADYLQNALLFAITEHQHLFVIWARSKNADIHHTDVLLHALKCENATCIKRLVEWGVKINQTQFNEICLWLDTDIIQFVRKHNHVQVPLIQFCDIIDPELVDELDDPEFFQTVQSHVKWVNSQFFTQFLKTHVYKTKFSFVLDEILQVSAAPPHRETRFGWWTHGGPAFKELIDEIFA